MQHFYSFGKRQNSSRSTDAFIHVQHLMRYHILVNKLSMMLSKMSKNNCASKNGDEVDSF